MIQGTLFGAYRSYGLLYKVLLDQWHVSRSAASWPFSLCMTVIHLTGESVATVSVTVSRS